MDLEEQILKMPFTITDIFQSATKIQDTLNVSTIFLMYWKVSYFERRMYLKNNTGSRAHSQGVLEVPSWG
jgi:hypothetical protein